MSIYKVEKQEGYIFLNSFNASIPRISYVGAPRRWLSRTHSSNMQPYDRLLLDNRHIAYVFEVCPFYYQQCRFVLKFCKYWIWCPCGIPVVALSLLNKASQEPTQFLFKIRVDVLYYLLGWNYIKYWNWLQLDLRFP